jgi:hypothetical protein
MMAIYSIKNTSIPIQTHTLSLDYQERVCGRAAKEWAEAEDDLGY